MASETIDAALKGTISFPSIILSLSSTYIHRNFISAVPSLQPKHEECQTDGLLIEGAHGWTPTMYIRLVQDFGLECEVAQHLAKSYGDRAFAVAKLASLTGKRWPIIGKKVHPEFPYIDAEVFTMTIIWGFFFANTSSRIF